MFIRITMMLVTTDEDAEEYEEHGWVECLINSNMIFKVYQELDGTTWIEQHDSKYIKVKENINEIHEKINRSLFLPLLH